MAATPAQVREVIGKYMEAWATGNKELLLSIFAEDATWEDPVGSPAFVGHEGVAKFWDFARQGADEGRTISPRIDQVIACGNEGILRFTMQVRLPAENKGLEGARLLGRELRRCARGNGLLRAEHRAGVHAVACRPAQRLTIMSATRNIGSRSMSFTSAEAPISSSARSMHSSHWSRSAAPMA